MDLAIHPKSQRKLDSLSQDLPHAVLLAGEHGVGLATIARQLAGKRLAAFVEPHDTKGQANHNTGTITVESIRDLYDQTRSKQTSRQVIIIDDADRMSSGAQAAFLKLLEEPSANTHFVLTSHSPQRLLPTVRSRVQTVTIEALAAEQTATFIDTLAVHDTKTRLQLEFLATGLPAELTRLTADETYFKKRAEIMADTRTLLTESTYKKLLIVHKYHQSKESALQLLDSALAVTRRSISAKPQPNLITQLDRILMTREKINSNGNVRLQLMAFVL